MNRQDPRNASRCYAFVGWLSTLEVEDEAQRQQEILEKVTEVGLNRSDFIHLDEKPGEYGYKVTPEGYWAKEGAEWHWKLRRVRNDPDSDLFDRLANS